ncbi:MAG: ferredoxin [Anaerolineae bacterium]
MKPQVDRDLCIGSANCVATAPTVFELDNEGISTVIDPTGANEQTLREAADGCPVAAITLVDDEGNQVYP